MHVRDDDVDITIPIDVFEGGAAAEAFLHEPRVFRGLDERSLSGIEEQLIRLGVPGPTRDFIHLGPDVPVHERDITIPISIVSASPAPVAVLPMR